MADPLPLPPSPPQPQQPQHQGPQWQMLLKLLPMIAIAGKQGGRDGVAGFLQGYQQAKMQREQQQQQAGQQQQQMAGQDQLRQAQIQNYQSEADSRNQQRRLDFLKQIQGAIGGFDSPEQFDQYAQLIGPQAQQFGIDPGAITAMKPAPDVYRQKKIASFFKGKSEKDLELAHRTHASYNIPGVGVVPYEEWTQITGGAVDAQGNAVLPSQQPNDLSKSGLDVQAADALARGDMETYQRLLKVKKEMGQADDPAMKSQMDQLRLQNLLTQTQLAQQRLAEIQKQGGVKLSPAQQGDLSDMKLLSDQTTEVLKMGGDMGWVGTGGLKAGSISQFMLSNFGRGDARGAKLRAAIGNIRGYIAKLRGGTSFTPNEQRLLDTYTPSIDESPESNIQKMQQLQDFLVKKADALVNTATGNPVDVVNSMRTNVAQPSQLRPVPSHGQQPTTTKQRIGRFEVEVSQ